MKTPPSMMTVGVHGGPVERLTDNLIASLRELGSIQPQESPSFLDALSQRSNAGVEITLMDTVPELVAAVKERVENENGVLPLSAFNAARKENGQYKGGSAGDPQSAYEYVTRNSEVSQAFGNFLESHPTMAYVGYNSLAGSGLALSEAIRSFLPETPVAEFGVVPQVGERSSALDRGKALGFAIQKREELRSDHTLFRLDNDLLAALSNNRSKVRAPTQQLAEIHQSLWRSINAEDLNGLVEGLKRLEDVNQAKPSDGNWLWSRVSLPVRVILSNPVRARVYKASEAFTDVRDFVRLFGGREWIPGYSPTYVDVEDLTPWLLHPIASSMQPSSAIVVTAGYSQEDIATIQRTLERTGIDTVTPLQVGGPAVQNGELWVYISIEDNPYLRLKRELMSVQSQEAQAQDSVEVSP